MKKIGLSLTAVLAVATMTLTGCGGAEPKYACPNGIQDPADSSKCMVTSGPLKGTVTKIDCEEADECVAYVKDERGRTIRTAKVEGMKVGGMVNIVLYNKATVIEDAETEEVNASKTSEK